MLVSPFDFIAQCFVSAILSILFIQSGLDKVIDRAGNMEWLKVREHVGETMKVHSHDWRNS